jgi:hypothetical protein
MEVMATLFERLFEAVKLHGDHEESIPAPQPTRSNGVLTAWTERGSIRQLALRFQTCAP